MGRLFHGCGFNEAGAQSTPEGLLWVVLLVTRICFNEAGAQSTPEARGMIGTG